ncbi:MAG: hypothetical protein ABIQ72_06610 [Usitatibacter sp.]
MKSAIIRMSVVSTLFACTGALAAEVQLQSTMQDAIKVATREPAIGTNVSRADIETRPISPGVMAEIVRQASAAALKTCGGSAKIDVMASDMVSPDFVGDSVTRLSGVGLYVTVSERGLRGSGTGYISPFVSLRLKVSGAALKQPREVEVTGFERIQISRSDTLQFINEKPGEIARAVISFASRVVEQRLRQELASDCTMG